MPKWKMRLNEPADFVLDVEENAFDSLKHAVEHFLVRDESTNLKYTILHTFHATELFLKARLAKEHPTLIFVKPEEAGDEGKTVDFSTLCARLKTVGVPMDEKHVADLHVLRRTRNAIEHSRLKLSRGEVEVYLGHAMRFLEGFIEEELGVVLKDKLPAEIYISLSEALYSYEERIKTAEEKLRQELGKDRDGIECEDVECPECNEQTMLCPSPDNRKEAICYFCGYAPVTDRCIRCNAIRFILGISQQDDDLGICSDCWMQSQLE